MSWHAASAAGRTHGCALLMYICATGTSHVVSSSIPAQMLIDCGRPTRSPYIGPPQPPQNHDVTSAPVGDRRRHPFGAPCRIWKSFALTGMFSANALPDVLWQLVQLQV